MGKYKYSQKARMKYFLHVKTYRLLLSELPGEHELLSDLGSNFGTSAGPVERHGRLLDLFPGPGHKDNITYKKVIVNIKYDKITFPTEQL